MSIEFEENNPAFDGSRSFEPFDFFDPSDIPGWVEPDLPELPGNYLDDPDPDPAASAPGAEDPLSLRLLSVLAAQVPADATTSALVDQLGVWQKFTGFSTSRIWIHIAELHTRFTAAARTRLDQAAAEGDQSAGEAAADRYQLAERSLTAELACALSWSSLRAGDQLDIALILTTDLSATLDAVTHGRLEVKKAEAIARALHREDPHLRRLVEAEVLPHAAGWTVPHLHDQIRTSLLRAAPELAKQRAERARRMRGVSFKPQPDDMIRLEAHLPVEDGTRVQAALNTTAHDIKATQTPTGPDHRGLDQIRADVLSDTLINLTRPPVTDTTDTTTTDTTTTGSDTTGDTTPGGTTPGGAAAGRAASGEPADEDGQGGERSGAGVDPPPKPRSKPGLRREVVITVPLETITGEAEHPGYLSRYGPISAHTARRIAHHVAQDGYWRCAVTDDTHGTLLGLGRSTFTPAYQAPEYLQRFVNLRDQTCDFPGCRIPAATCDYDHTIPYPKGSTCECGGAKRCGNHHRLKHETAWQVRRSDNPEHPPGTHIWTSPTGREYPSSPPPLGVPASRNTSTITPDAGPGAGRGAPRPGQPASGAWTYDPTLTELPTATPPPVEQPEDNPPPF